MTSSITQTVSVVIPTYGRPDKLANALESINGQTFAEWHVIIVDDNGLGSQDQMLTAKVVAQSPLVSRITYHIQPENMGACAARNKGISLAQGKYIAFLDDDDEWFAEKLEKQVAALESQSAHVCYCDMYLTFAGRKKYHFHRIAENTTEVLFNRGFGICTSALLVSTEAARSVSGFDESLPSMQDYDFLIRLSKAYPFVELQEALLVYQLADDGISCNPVSKLKGHQGIINKYEHEYLQRNLLAGLSRQYESLADFQLRSDERRSSVASYSKAVSISRLNPRLLVKMVIGMLLGKGPLEWYLAARQKYSSQTDL